MSAATAGSNPDAVADALALQLLGMPEGERTREFARLMDEDDTVATLVSKRMDDLRARARG